MIPDYLIRQGGPAFPSLHQDGIEFLGLTARDYFAAASLPRLVHTGVRNPEEVAALAYAIADAMLAESKKPTATEATP